MDLKNIWTIEYCKRQDQFHIDKLENMVRENLKYLLTGKRLEWIIVGLSTSREDADNLTEKIRKKIGKRKPMV